tara:strand:+ start:3855 stop:4037 length:183 start_codon:yes stop_codon:yes gene_type:complete
MENSGDSSRQYSKVLKSGGYSRRGKPMLGILREMLWGKSVLLTGNLTLIAFNQPFQLGHF